MDIEVEVVLALPGREDAVTLRVPEGASLLDAVRASGILGRHPELREKPLQVGVYGQARRPESPAQQGDRVEIYRKLAADPKDARRQRAKKKRV
ncbi:MAG TPA: RnfH family protein [Burkholderiales bacterium]|nr:RnfH family protein [Burkholderiales bacterium]